MEKILISCCGSHLQECGIGSVFVENEIFGPGVVQSVLSWGEVGGTTYVAKRYDDAT